MQKIKLALCLTTLILFLCSGYTASAQSNQNDVAAQVAKGLKLRGIGPSVLGGRIADIAVAQPIAVSGMWRWAQEVYGKPATVELPGNPFLMINHPTLLVQ